MRRKWFALIICLMFVLLSAALRAQVAAFDRMGISAMRLLQ